jgi:hypothetical protein
MDSTTKNKNWKMELKKKEEKKGLTNRPTLNFSTQLLT